MQLNLARNLKTKVKWSLQNLLLPLVIGCVYSAPALAQAKTSPLAISAPNWSQPIQVSSELPPVSSGEQCEQDGNYFAGGDSFVPWPWGKEIAFPWNEMQGTWKVQTESLTVYFSFKIVGTTNEIRQLQVTEHENRTCRVVASGSGYESNKVLRALLRSADSDTPSVFLIRGFRTADVPCLEFPIDQTQVFVVSVRDISVNKSSHYMITKVSSAINQCPIEE